MTVVLRTHGGLGNQLFQIFFARLCAKAGNIEYVELHDANYEHHFARSTELWPAPAVPTKLQRIISNLRIPKILSRLKLRKGEAITVFGDRFLDGYFQQESDFSVFPDELIASQITQLRAELGIKPVAATNKRTLYHIRLGDFFNDEQAAMAHAIERVSQLQPNSTIITNQEALF